MAEEDLCDDFYFSWQIDVMKHENYNYNSFNNKNEIKSQNMKNDEIIAKIIQEDLDNQYANELMNRTSHSDTVEKSFVSQYLIDRSNTNDKFVENEIKRQNMKNDEIIAKIIQEDLDNQCANELMNRTSHSDTVVKSFANKYNNNNNRNYVKSNSNSCQKRPNSISHLRPLNNNLNLIQPRLANNQCVSQNLTDRRDTNDEFGPNNYEALLELDKDIKKKGLKENELNSLVCFEFKMQTNIIEDDKKCTICFEDFKNKDKIIALGCLHKYHNNCILKWLTENRTCPMCNKDAINGK